MLTYGIIHCTRIVGDNDPAIIPYKVVNIAFTDLLLYIIKRPVGERVHTPADRLLDQISHDSNITVVLKLFISRLTL